MMHILCRVVWADEYKSKKEDFFAGNMKYPTERKDAHELLNFADEDGYAYGYVANNDSRINLKNFGAPADAEEIDGVTVIWCALDKAERKLRVVGWYDNATAYGELKSAKRGSIRGDYHYLFRTKIDDAHLMPSAERFLEVPMRARRTDKGYIGQRNWHFPEQHLPQYSRFLDSFSELKLGRQTSTEPNEIDRNTYEEGQRAMAEINLAIRNPKLVAAAKTHYGYRCQVCDFSFEERYGNHGKEFIEVHHLLPIAARKEQRASTIDDVRVVCANCHRMLHHGPKLLDLAELKALLK
jgi:hypothetical protein